MQEIPDSVKLRRSARLAAKQISTHEQQEVLETEDMVADNACIIDVCIALVFTLLIAACVV